MASRDRIVYQEYLPLEEPTSKYNCVEVCVFYDLGGYNYLTSVHTERGYYVITRPTHRTVKNGLVSESYALFDRTGCQRYLSSANRYSSKGADKALADAQEWIKYMLTLLADEGLKVAEPMPETA